MVYRLIMKDIDSGENKLVELGYCNRAHGIRGGFTFSLHNEIDSVLQDKLPITLLPSGEGRGSSSLSSDGQEFIISKVSFGNKVIAYLEGVNERNQVEAMIPFTIFLSRDLFPEVVEGEFYVEDLLGVIVNSHADGSPLGKIDSFYDNGAQIVFVVLLDSGEKIDVPFVDNFFPVVDLDKNIIELILPNEV